MAANRKPRQTGRTGSNVQKWLTVGGAAIICAAAMLTQPALVEASEGPSGTSVHSATVKANGHVHYIRKSHVLRTRTIEDARLIRHLQTTLGKTRAVPGLLQRTPFYIGSAGDASTGQATSPSGVQGGSSSSSSSTTATGGVASGSASTVGQSSVNGAGPVKVLIVGGSIARGWNDTPGQGGYLVRALRVMADKNQTQYAVYDHAIPGERVGELGSQYGQWLNQIHPDITILSWGLLNDAHATTPMAMVNTQIRQQIQEALAVHSVVFVVTPPVSQVSYTTYRHVQSAMIQREMRLCSQLNNPNVYVFDVFAQMKNYLQLHHLTYQPFMSNSWHPNAAGHQLAASILAQDWLTTFRLKQVDFVDSGNPVQKQS